MTQPRVDPPPSRIRANDWRPIAAEVASHRSPRETVSVVIPCRNHALQLELALASLAEQSYPRRLLQVVVVDDGSDEPLRLEGSELGLDVQVVRTEGGARSPARAINAGAAYSEGEILLLLDADMIVERTFVEGLARWHHVVSDALVWGDRIHVDAVGLTPSEVRAAVAENTLPSLFEGRAQWRPTWLDERLARHDMLRSSEADLYLAVTGANLSIRKQFFDEVGGWRVVATRGTEDTIFGYRVFNAGGVLIPDSRYRCWHQGASVFQTEDRFRLHEERVGVVANFVPTNGRIQGPIRAVPAVHVDLRPADEPAPQIVEALHALLTGTFSDLAATVELAPDDERRDLVATSFSAEPRVRLGAASADIADAPFRLLLPGGPVAAQTTLESLVERMTAAPDLGVLRLTVPGRSPSKGLPELWRQRAWRRARRLADAGIATDEDLAGGFDEEWLPGSDFGLRNGPAMECVVCGSTERGAAPASEPWALTCSACGSSAADRLGFMYLCEIYAEARPEGAILSVGKSPLLAEALSRREGLDARHTTPANLPHVLREEDLLVHSVYISEPDVAASLDDATLRRVHRLLDPAGRLILPVVIGAPNEESLSSLIRETPEERLEPLSSADFQSGLRSRLESHGFVITIDGLPRRMAPEDSLALGLPLSWALLYCKTRPGPLWRSVTTKVAIETASGSS